MDVFDAVRTRRKELGVPGVAVGLLRDGEERHEGFGRGDDALARYVDGMRTLPQLTPLGEVWSYNNAGFALAGRAIEVATGERFEDVVQRLVLEPLELAATTYRPWDAMTERFAVGHVGDEPGVAHPWPLARSTNPAGGVISTTPDLLRYARLHLDPPPALARMQLRQVDIGDEGEWMGLTWYGEDAFGTIRHGGTTHGQQSLLVLRPGTGLALAVLTNHAPGGKLLADAALEALGLLPRPPQPVAGAPVDEYVGVYETTLSRLTLRRSGDRLGLEQQPLGGFPARDSPPGRALPPMHATFYDRERFVVDDGPLAGSRGHFLRQDGEVAWLRIGGRINRRIADAPGGRFARSPAP